MLGAGGVLTGAVLIGHAARGSAGDLAGLFAGLEASLGGRLGVAALDPGSGRRIAYRADELFPMCSTFKFLAAAFALARTDRGEEDPARRVIYGEADLFTYSPGTGPKAGSEGMTVSELLYAALYLSENTSVKL